MISDVTGISDATGYVTKSMLGDSTTLADYFGELPPHSPEHDWLERANPVVAQAVGAGAEIREWLSFSDLFRDCGGIALVQDGAIRRAWGTWGWPPLIKLPAADYCRPQQTPYADAGQQATYLRAHLDGWKSLQPSLAMTPEGKPNGVIKGLGAVERVFASEAEEKGFQAGFQEAVERYFQRVSNAAAALSGWFDVQARR